MFAGKSPLHPSCNHVVPTIKCRSSGPLGALLSSPALDVRLLTALQVLQGQPQESSLRVRFAMAVTCELCEERLRYAGRCFCSPLRHFLVSKQASERTNKHDCLPAASRQRVCKRSAKQAL